MIPSHKPHAFRVVGLRECTRRKSPGVGIITDGAPREMVKLDITLILLAGKLADVVACAGLGAYRAKDVVLVAGKHILGIVG